MMAFSYNNYERWKANFVQFPFVTAIQADCSTVDYASLGPIKLAFLDVDLYAPTRRTLPKLYDALTNDGVILVEDVKHKGSWDGAYQAYMEFCSELGITPEIRGNKCGIVCRPRTL